MNFSYPILVYIALLVSVLCLVIFALNAKKKQSELKKFASEKLADKLVFNVSKFKIFFKAVLLAASAGAIIFALARPKWGYTLEEQTQMGVDIIFAIDTSKSMLAEDLKPNRLERAKLAISDIIDRLNGDRIGLVAFAGQAFLQCPITLDYDAFKMSLDSLDTNVIQRGGTNIASAISEAQAALNSKAAEKIIVLISDGEELESSAIKKAESISKNNGIKIFTVGIGSTTGEPIPVRDTKGGVKMLRDEKGKLVSSKLNEDVLREVANATGGFYANFSNGGMEQVFEEGIATAQKSLLTSKVKKTMIERFQLPLALALILLAFELVIGTRKMFAKRGFYNANILLFAAVCATFASKNLHAQDEGQTLAPTTWNAAYNIGIDEFQKGDFAKAKENFYKSLLPTLDLEQHSKSYFNIACTDYETAKSAIKDLPDLKEDLSKAKACLDGVSSTISSGLNVLKDGLAAQKKGEDALKEQNLQNQIKQSISLCQNSKKEIDESEKSSTQTVQKLQAVAASALSARANFQNAKELNPKIENVEKNLSASEKAEKNLNSFLEEFAKNAAQYSEAKTKLDKLIEELKKLLRDEENKQNQDKQNQQNQENQNDQNKDNNQNQNDKNQQKNQDNQQQNQNQNNQNNSQQNQNQDNQENQQNNKNEQNNKQNEKQNSQEGKQNANEQAQNDKNSENDSQHQDAKESSQGKQDDKQNKPDDKQNKQGEEQNEEQAATNENDVKAEENALEQNPQPAEKADKKEVGEEENATENKEEKQGAAAASAEENAQPQNDLDYRAAKGVMTRREASQILDAQKENDKKLPFSGYGNQRRRYEQDNYKDW